MKNINPIGFFDSGVGGTSIWSEVHALLPHENSIYLADSKNAPYGLKTKEEIIALSFKNAEFLLELNCKLQSLCQYMIYSFLLIMVQKVLGLIQPLVLKFQEKRNVYFLNMIWKSFGRN